MDIGMKLIQEAQPCDEGMRLDKFLSERCDDLSRSFAAQLAEDGRVTLNGQSVGKKYIVKGGDVFELDVPEPRNIELMPENIPLDVVYEDDDLLVVYKPQGMVVHPAPGNETGTLVNALLHHCQSGLSSINGVIRPGIVHRIDKDTSGLLVVAKSDLAHRSLAEQLKEHKALRRYWALVRGNMTEDSGTVDKPLARHPVNRKRMAIAEGGREAVTNWRVLERFGMYTLVECTLETGRTHQIRVHMMSIGHSIVGDKEYGSRKKCEFNLNGQLLHAKTIGFMHPRTGEEMEFDSEIPSYFVNVLKILRLRR